MYPLRCTFSKHLPCPRGQGIALPGISLIVSLSFCSHVAFMVQILFCYLSIQLLVVILVSFCRDLLRVVGCTSLRAGKSPFYRTSLPGPLARSGCIFRCCSFPDFVVVWSPSSHTSSPVCHTLRYPIATCNSCFFRWSLRKVLLDTPPLSLLFTRSLLLPIPFFFPNWQDSSLHEQKLNNGSQL